MIYLALEVLVPSAAAYGADADGRLLIINRGSTVGSVKRPAGFEAVRLKRIQPGYWI